MRLSAVWVLLPASVCSGNPTSGHSTTLQQLREYDGSLYQALPSCVKHCVDSTTTDRNCLVNDISCLCNSRVDYRACLGRECGVLLDVLAGQKYWAESCNEPIRNGRPRFRAVLWAVFSLATISVVMRLLSRLPILYGSGCSWDDLVTACCYALTVALSIVSELGSQSGLGLDMYWLTAQEMMKVLELFMIAEILYNTVIIGTKIAIVLLYLRVWSVDVAPRNFRLACWVLIWLLVFTVIAFAIVIVFQCTPVSYTWRYVVSDDGHCYHLVALTFVFAMLNIIYDVIIFVLPIHNLCKLNIPMARKLRVCAVFLVGFVVTICSVIRLQYLVRFRERSNASWTYQYVALWSIVEGNLLLVCACLPAALGLLQRCRKQLSNKPSIEHPGYIRTSSRDNNDEGETGRSRPAATLCIEDLGTAAEIETLPTKPYGRTRAKRASASDVLEHVRSDSKASIGSVRSPDAIALRYQFRRESTGSLESSRDPRTGSAAGKFKYEDQEGVLHWVTLRDKAEEKLRPG